MSEFLTDSKNKVTNCDRNISQMNIFQFGYYFGFEKVKDDILFVLKEFIKVFNTLFWVIVSILIFPIVLIYLPFVWQKRINKAKKVMKKYDEALQELNDK